MCDVLFMVTFAELFVDVNVASTARIYEIVVRDNLPIKKIIVASSQAALGEGLYLDLSLIHI